MDYRAPVMKWAIVLAGVSDFFRPPEKLSLTQNLALTATGSIWTRWCLIIKPKNYLYVHLLFCSFSLKSYFLPVDFEVAKGVRNWLTALSLTLSLHRLAAVNFCLAIVGAIQVSRILTWRSSVEGSKEKALEDIKEEVKDAAKGVKEDVKKVVS